MAKSDSLRYFSVVLAIAMPIVYVACEMANWPLFTYHPATGRLDLGYAPAVRDEGPAMYWYGWTATALLGSSVLGLSALLLPRGFVRALPLSLVWITTLASVPVLIYALRFFWRW